ALLRRALAESAEWKEYIITGETAGGAASISNGKQNALAIYRNNELVVNLRAVYQPNEWLSEKARLEKTTDGFALLYGESERYEFTSVSGSLLLKEAEIGEFRVFRQVSASEDLFGYYPYTVEDGSEKTVSGSRYTIDSFNISLFPRSVPEVKELRLALRALESGSGSLAGIDDSIELKKVGKGTAPVYSSPYGSSAWRGANGKAALGLSGDFRLLGLNIKNDCGFYCAVSYKISESAGRIGYVLATELGSCAKDFTDNSESIIHVEVLAKRDTYLTDDPDFSQSAAFQVPEGTRFDCMGTYGGEYAYVSAEVNAKGFTDGGAIIWGFVPLRDIYPDTMPPYAQIQTEAMKSLDGSWIFSAGGSLSADALQLNSDGSYLSGHIDESRGEFVIEDEGTWYITSYNAFRNQYWNDPAYEITLISPTVVNVCGLEIEQDGFSLSNWEGGGGYTRFDEPLKYVYINEDTYRNG
ncbi:MAG: hypothetical protein PHU22_11095, partial [Eubacteriales bacterium]|nr:hypothetical protein [Eubacteriales bacterium]